MFRQEALESRVKGFSNPVSIKGSLAVNLMLAGIFAAAAGLIAFGWFTDYTRRAAVKGYLRPEAGSVSVTATRAGRLFVAVPNGALVTQGEKLARIAGYDVDASGQSLLEIEIQDLEATKALYTDRGGLGNSDRPGIWTSAKPRARVQREVM